MKEIEIVNEATYTFGSNDNSRFYPFELDLSRPWQLSSIHGIVLDGEPAAVFGASGGATGVHEHSLLCIRSRCYLAVGPYVVCFNTRPFKYYWSKQLDYATCFGVHYNKDRDILISHGELEIVCFTPQGEKVWTASGRDIFTGEIILMPDHIEVTDFYGNLYQIDYTNGQVRG